jgi:ABC-type branched-subunit amino acid transport system ATPase component/ABC-type branched-subunit amino acid transport system permease subunit
VTVAASSAAAAPAAPGATGGGQARKLAIAAVVVFAAIAIPFNLSAYLLNVLVLALIFGIVAIGLDILMGYTGLDSLGQAAFYGTSAYTIGILTVNNGVDWYVAALAALALATLLAVAVGFVAVRLGGLYFLLITLAFGQVLWGGVQRWGDFTGGFNGLSGVPMPADFLTEPLNFCYFALVIFAIVLWLSRLVVSSPFGLGLRGCRDDEERLGTLGFRSFRLKWIAFVIAGLLAAVGGVLSATFNSFVSPSDMDLQLSFAIMLMVIVGGAGYIYGAVVGALVVTVLQYELSVYIEDWWVLILGLVYVVTAVFLPNGILGSVRLPRRWRSAEPGPGPAAERSPAAAESPAVIEAATTAEPPARAPAAATTGEPILELDDISLAFGGFKALEGISLAFQPGERTAIIGPNGAGKTTLFNVVSGIYRPSRGSIVAGGTDLTGLPTYARPTVGLARTFQVTKVFAPLTVLENMTLGLLGWSERRHQYTMLRRTPRTGELHDRARDELARVGLSEFADAPVHSLSYGHQKQLDIALALASKPRLLLLDEPTAGLSQSEAQRMMGLVDGLPAEITVLIIEHNLDFVFGLTDRLIVLDHGQVLVDGPQSEVRRSEEVRRIYFGTRG